MYYRISMYSGRALPFSTFDLPNSPPLTNAAGQRYAVPNTSNCIALTSV